MFGVCLIILILLLQGDCKGNGDMRLVSLTFCRGPNITYVADIHIRNDTDSQWGKGSVTLLEDFDNKRYSCTAFAKQNSNDFKQIISMHGRNVCSTLKKLGGKFLQELEVMANVPSPGTCPIKAGVYASSDWIHINYSQFQILSLIPKGTFKIVCEVYDNDQSSTIVSCVRVDAFKL